MALLVSNRILLPPVASVRRIPFFGFEAPERREMALPALRASPAALVPPLLRRYPRRLPLPGKPFGGNRPPPAGCGIPAASAATVASPLTGAKEALMGFIAGKRKATEVAHLVWKNVLIKGDSVIDATCGNGHDTLALLRMIADDSGRGFVYAMDIQSSALESTSSLLDESVNPNQRKRVELFCLCHSKMEDVIPQGVSIRLVAFNLGYLPGGDKGIITASNTTLLALQAASRILVSGGLISIVAYVGHPGAREEYDTVQAFASGLPVDLWATCKLEMLNRPAAPVLILLFKK